MKNKSMLILISTAIIISILAFVAVFGISLGNFVIKPAKDMLKLGLDIKGGVVIVYEAQTDLKGDDLKKVMDQTKGVIERRVNALGLTEPSITVQGSKRIRIELPGVKDAEQAISMIGKTAKLQFLLVAPNSIATEGMNTTDFDSELILEGGQVKDAGLSTDQYGKPAVSLEFDSEGTQKFSDGTKKAVNYPGGEGQIAIVLDDSVISAPTTKVIIPDGKAIITGNFTVEEATGLSALIRGGSLPVDLLEIQSSIIGPTLGLDALKTSVTAAQIGFLLVIAFMVFYYRIPGLVSAVSLILYCSMVIFILIGFKATLTLPGIAGIVLSVGMAVDANVISFERIKEEIKVGKTIRASIEAGFKRAFLTIFDSNITTIIAAIVLFNFGEGPIKGFAITLMIGILCSMFTAIVVTRTILKSLNTIGLFNHSSYFGVKEVSHDKNSF